jgi:protein-tyrosine phosphatase
MSNNNKIYCTLVFSILLAACSVPAEDRAIAAQLPAEQREAQRLLPLDGAHNFRDLGGYSGADGRSVKWGLLYRSDALDSLSDEDQQLLQRLGLKQIVDLRSDFEKEEAPDVLPQSLKPYYKEHPVDVEGTAVRDLMRAIIKGETEGLDLKNLLVTGNDAFVSSMLAPFRAHVHSLLNENNLPSVAHCTGGKDRAGFAAAVTLLALGVSREDIMHDYLLTNDYTRDEIKKREWMIRFGSLFQTDPAEVRPLLGVEKRYLQAAFDAIDRIYGSDEAFLREGLQLSEQQIDQLRTRFLEPAA